MSAEDVLINHRIEVVYHGGPKDGQTIRHDLLGPPAGAHIPPVLVEPEYDDENSSKPSATYIYHPVRIEHRAAGRPDVLVVVYFGET